ncbi:hypothetical protein ADICYQ_4118 [Cyclobacterium qasimii M12-11B]|uniref:Uncharacterized protein n=1 Tax=Cyclobacterium qasimii M12-11B TaxID=641524 RepID=S7VBC0_9BACT|nr:hypothetical protein ADICYQ_4118 [Cyclobacterium qasimii M12-11B]
MKPERFYLDRNQLIKEVYGFKVLSIRNIEVKSRYLLKYY